MQDQAAGKPGQDTERAISRERTWDEKSDSERVQLLRRELRTALTHLSALHQEFQKLSQHSHLPDGRIAVPYYGGQAGETAGPIGYRYDPLA